MDSAQVPQLPGAAARTALNTALAHVNSVVLGKPNEVRLAFTCLLARGHLLIEDLPGVGKTTLAHAVAATLGLSFHRIQFTADMLPSDIIGVSIWHRERSEFEFHPGPVFAQVLLADEVNRASPKTQSALLEAMAEQQITVDGVTRPLPDPFFVIATQNPTDLAGTFALPDSQLDRFLMRLSLGYPDPAAERQMLASRDRREVISDLFPVLDGGQIQELRRGCAAVHASAPLIDYVQALLQRSRSDSRIAVGLSPRAGLALLAAARAHALLANRDHVRPEDVQDVFVSVAAHRLQPATEVASDGRSLARTLLEQTAIP